VLRRGEGDPEQLPIVTFLNPGIAVAADERNRVISWISATATSSRSRSGHRDQATFDAWAPEAMQVVDSSKFN
jgi:hypothetical protein